MLRAALTAALLLTAAFAGCLGGDDDPGPSPPPTGGDGGSGADGGDGGTDPPPAEARAPSWFPGLWWSWRVKNQLASEFEVTTVVTEVSPDSYEVGFTELDPGLRSIVFHLPPVGTLQRPNLGWWYHDTTTALLDFPLTDGKTWQSPFQDETVSFTSTATPGPGLTGTGTQFAIEGVDEDGNLRVQATWSPAAGQFLEVALYLPGQSDPFTRASLIDGGTVHADPVLVPSMTDHYNQATQGPDASGAGLAPPSPPTLFTVPEGTSQVVVAAFLGGAEGLYEATFVPPGGGPVTVTQRNQPGESAVGFEMLSYEERSGDWAADLRAGGPGFIFAEVIGVTLEERAPGTGS